MKKYLAVDEFLANLTEDRRQQVNALRQIISSVNKDLSEHIKWNSPSYIYNGEDRLTFNMHYPDKTILLLHMGATRKEDRRSKPIMNDESGLIIWNSNIRGTLSFSTLDEIENHTPHIEKIIAQWLAT